MPERQREIDSASLRVAHVIGHLQVGGAEKQFVNLMNSLAVAERIAVIISPRRDEPGLYDELDPGIKVLYSPVRKRTLFRDIYRLSRLMRELSLDVVHTHMFWPNLYGSVAARLANIPVVVTTEHGENKWKKFRHRLLERWIISRVVLKRFCVSQQILSRRRDVDGVPAELLELTVNGTTVPSEPAPGLKEGETVIGSVGRAVVQKNFPLFVDVIRELGHRGYEVTGCIVGDGPMLPAIRDYIDRSGLSGVVRTPGMSSDVDGWYRNFGIYLISSDQEGQPVSLLEAMAYGLPVVATDVGAISKTLVDGEEGLIAEAGNVTALADCVCRFIDNRSFAEACGSRARERVIADYSISAAARAHEKSYVALYSRAVRPDSQRVSDSTL